MLILNPEYERNKVPAALGALMKDLLVWHSSSREVC